MEYTLQHSCFKCRKSYKKLVPGKEQGISRDSYLYNEKSQIDFNCPECGEKLYPMGKSFSAPKKNKIEQWEVVEKLYRNGFRFIGSGFHSGDPLPTKMSELDSFLKENQNHPLRIIKNNI
jgi:rRNA maturation protein Nop10